VGRAACRAVQRQECHESDGQERTADRDRIGGADLIKGAHYKPCGDHCGGSANDRAASDHDEAVAKDELPDVTRTSPESHPHADFVGAACDGMGNHAIQTDGGEEDTEQGRDAE